MPCRPAEYDFTREDGEQAEDRVVTAPPRPEDAGRGRYHYPEHGSWALELLFRADREERWLCEARTVLMQVARHRAPSADLASSFEDQLQAHRAHRGEDLEAVRSALRLQIQYLERQDSGPNVELNQLRDKLARAKALSIDDILHDRDELESLWP
jgi:hypothetical protein